jgi:tRNA-specific 2-thiouridylase
VRVLVALSGGVDSAVAAALLIEQGYDVVGAMLRLWAEPGAPEDAGTPEDVGAPEEVGTPGDVGTPEDVGAPEAAGVGVNRCCTPEAVDRARRVTDRLDVPFYLINAEASFSSRVVDYFVAEYAAGRTPNPCVLCNRFIRFGFLLDRALAAEANYMATGHYARVRKSGGRYQLLRGLDAHKDQSYFLHTLTQEQLAHVLFPLGALTKGEVRALARKYGLPVAEQPESQDVCFLADGDYRHFLARVSPDLFRPGPIRDTAGRVLGQHQGLPAYTIGQRKGLGLTAPEPLYVLAIEPAENALVVGLARELGQDECLVEGMHYVDGETPPAPFHATAQIRYRARPVEVEVTPLPHRRANVRFASPQRDITPGQFLVVYDGQVVLGGGAICKAQQPML